METTLKKILIAGFKSCGIVLLDPQQILKQIPNLNSNTISDSWLRTFEGFLETRRDKETTVRTKKRRLTVPPGQSIAHSYTNSDDEDDPEVNIVLSNDEDEISVNKDIIGPIPGTNKSTQEKYVEKITMNLNISILATTFWSNICMMLELKKNIVNCFLA